MTEPWSGANGRGIQECLPEEERVIPIEYESPPLYVSVYIYMAQISRIF